MLRSITTLALSVLVTSSVSAQQPPASTNHFAPLEFLVGHCFRGTFPDGKQTDEHCFEWVYDRKFIRDKHVVRGGAPYGGETLYSWDPAAKRIAFSYWNTEGQVMTGQVVATAGDSLTFSTSVPGAAGMTEMRSSWVRRGADGFSKRELVRAGNDWKEAFSMMMTRVK